MAARAARERRLRVAVLRVSTDCRFPEAPPKLNQ